MMKKAIKVFWALAFIALVCFCFHRCTTILRYKVGRSDTIGSFYKLPANTVDILFVGSSHAYRSISPMKIWGETGYTAYDLASPSQSIPAAYFLIKEGIRTQHPKIIFLETYGSRFMSDYPLRERLHASLDAIPMNMTKFEIMTDFLPRTMTFEESLEYLFPIRLYHSKWEELTDLDFRPVNQFLRGYAYGQFCEPRERPDIPEGEIELYEGTLLYFDKIVDLCKKSNVELCLYRSPEAVGDKTEENMMASNALIRYAQSKGIGCIDFNYLRDDISLDYQTDFLNAGHVNYQGMCKITSYFSDLLSKEYSLEDHREDGRYAFWQKDYETYRTYLTEKEQNPDDPDEDDENL